MAFKMKIFRILHYLILLSIVNTNPLPAQMISIDKETLFFPTIDSFDTFTIHNSGPESLLFKHIGSTAMYYLYNFQVALTDTMVSDYFIDADRRPLGFSIAAGDSAKFTIFSPDLCPVCKASSRDYFEDTLLVANNSVNLDTVRIFMSGQGFNILAVEDTPGHVEITKPALHPCYPNPFNGATKISYDLPAQQHVKLAVYDIRGTEVAVLVDGSQRPGAHSVAFFANSLPSGPYFYRLLAGRFVGTGKLLLVK